jgi:hypothetical protein
MKYIITESQFRKLVNEDELPNSIRRRLSQFQDKIMELVSTTNANEFSDEFEYADNIISWALMDSNFEETDEIMDMLKEMYGDMLFEMYYDSTSVDSHNEDDDFM